MSRRIDSEDLAAMTRSGSGSERVASGRTRIAPVSWEIRLVALAILGIAALFGSGVLGSHPDSADRAALAGHTRLVEAVGFSPDGRTLASCGFDGTVRLWDVSRWDGGRPAEPETLEHPSVVFAMAFSPDGSLLAAAANRSVTIWSRDPSYHRLIERTGVSYRGVAFSPDGRTLALGSEDGEIRLWEMPEGRERAVLRGHTGSVWGLAFSPDGKQLATGGQDGRLVLWDPVAGTESRVLRESHPAPIRSLAFSPDGRSLGLAEPSCEASDFLIFDVETGVVRTRLFGHSLGTNDLAFLPDGRTLATAGVDRSIKLWDLDRGTVSTAVKEDRWVKSVAISPDGRWLAYAGGDEMIRLLDLKGQRYDSAAVPIALGRQG
jgi:WD40 repeat protein